MQTQPTDITVSKSSAFSGCDAFSKSYAFSGRDAFSKPYAFAYSKSCTQPRSIGEYDLL